MPRPQSVKALSNTTTNDVAARKFGRENLRNFGVAFSKTPCFSALNRQGSRKLRTAQAVAWNVEEQYLELDIATYTQYHDDLWTAYGTCNDKLIAAAAADPSLDIQIASAKNSVSNMVAYNNRMSANLGKLQVDTREEATITGPNARYPSGAARALDIGWASNMATAREGYISGLGSAYKTLAYTSLDALKGYGTATLEASIDKFEADFDNEHTYSDALLEAKSDNARDTFDAAKTQALAIVENDVTRRKAEAEYEAALARQLVEKLKPHVGPDFTAFQHQQTLLIIENGQKLTKEKSKLAAAETAANTAAKAIFFESMRQANTAYRNATTAAGIAHALQEQANEQAYRDAMNAATSAYNTALAVANATCAKAISTLASRWQAALEIVSDGGSVPTGFFVPGGNGGSGPVPLSAAKQGKPKPGVFDKDSSDKLVDNWHDANRYPAEMHNEKALQLLRKIRDVAANTGMFYRKTGPLDNETPFVHGYGYCVKWANDIMYQIENLDGAKRINTQDGILFLFDDGTAIAISPEILDYNGWGPIFFSHAVIRVEIGKGDYDENGRFRGEVVCVLYIDNGVYGGDDHILDLPEAQKSLLPYPADEPEKLLLDNKFMTPTMIKRPQNTRFNWL